MVNDPTLLQCRGVQPVPDAARQLEEVALGREEAEPDGVVEEVHARRVCRPAHPGAAVFLCAVNNDSEHIPLLNPSYGVYYVHGKHKGNETEYSITHYQVDASSNAVHCEVCC